MNDHFLHLEIKASTISTLKHFSDWYLKTDNYDANDLASAHITIKKLYF